MIKTLLQLAGLGIAGLVLLFFLAPRLVAGAGNALINSQNASKAHGLAQLVPDLQGKITNLQVQLDGLSPGSNYDVTLNQDQCNGPILRDIGTITTDKSGSTTALKSLSGLPNLNSHSVWLNVHQGGSTGTSLACGQVELNGQSQIRVDTSQPTDPPQQQVPTSLQSQAVPSTSVSNTITGQSSVDPGETRIRRNIPSGFGQTGVNPGGSDLYDSYTNPRKF